MPGDKVIQVTGDMTIDWLILQPRGAEAKNIDIVHKWGKVNCRAVSQAGGAALLSGLLSEMAKKSDKAKDLAINSPNYEEDAFNKPDYEGVAKAFISWSPFPAKGVKDREYVWRIKEFLGEDHPVFSEKSPEKAHADPGAHPDVLVIEDTNFGFRDNRQMWPEAITSTSGVRAKKPELIFLKVASPLDNDDLLSELVQKFANRLTVFTAVSDLRKSGCSIGNALSWEQIYEEIFRAVTSHDEIKKAARVVVTLGTSGAVMIEKKDHRSWLIFDPIHQEGDWGKGYQGEVVGYGTCVAASLIWEMAHDSSSPEMVEALKRGCHGARALHQVGYEEVGKLPSLSLSFPFKAIAKAIIEEPTEFAEAQLNFDSEEPQSILSANIGRYYKKKAKELVLQGPKGVLSGIPMERIGKWTSVDRNEIESMRSVGNILSEYVSKYRSGLRLERPLSIAVFGPPGSGKSFAIKQMADALFQGLIKDREFNLSQFDSIAALPSAFQQVRDLVLEQHLPLVFWDEFDTSLEGEELGWLKHFLAPMQDGHFREGGIFHPIGPAIFVFAGSQYSTMDEFKEKDKNKKKQEIHKRAKKEDFLSRLKGYVNILGPNKLEQGDIQDRNYVLRRAFLLRNILARKAPQLLDENEVINIDPGVLSAFIEVNKFFYGARSIEAMVDMSSLSGKGSYERSCLPAKHQLALHVDAAAFLGHVCRVGG
jgi:hypothetical protein